MEKYLRMYAADGDGAGGGKDIDLDFEGAISKALEMHDQAVLIQGYLSTISSAVDSMASSWQSNQAAKAKRVCDSFTENFVGFYNLIDSTPEKIKIAAEALKSAEGVE